MKAIGEGEVQIRRRCKSFQLLRRKKGTDEDKISYQFIGSTPVTSESINDVDDELCEELTDREKLQLENYLERQIEVTKRIERKKIFKKLPGILTKVSGLIEMGGDDYDEQEFLNIYELFSKALSNSGHSSKIATITLNSVTESIDKGVEIKDDQAKTIMQSWEELEAVLNKQGYSSKWYRAVSDVEL